MNFQYSEDQTAIKDVATRMFKDLCDDATIKTLFEQDKPFHSDLWQQLADNGLLGTALGEAHGGTGLGMTELCLLLESQGKTVAPVPVLETVVECAMPIEQFASDELKQQILPSVIKGELLLTCVRPYQGLQNKQPLQANQQGNDWILSGESALVSYGSLANGFMVVAQTENGEPLVAYCAADTKGIAVTEQRAMSGEAAAHLSFDQVQIAADQLIAEGDQAQALLAYQRQRSYTALAAMQVGMLREGIQRAADYTRERQQFGRPLAKFQAVAQQASDGYMAIESLRGVYWRALDDLDHGRDATAASEVAKFWVCEAGHITAHIFLHLHGGIGQDLEYPVHRFFTWAKKNELYLGTAGEHAYQLGQWLANKGQAATQSESAGQAKKEAASA